MHKTRNANLKFYIIGIAFVLVIVALIMLCSRCAKSGATDDATGADGEITTQIAAQDASGKNVSSKLLISAGTEVPDELMDVANSLLLMDISWNSNKDPSFPMILTVQDASFIDTNGVSVYHYAGGTWELIGTYLIENNSVSFQVTSLSPFAFKVIDRTETTPEPSPSPSASPSPSPSPSPSATPSASPSPSATPSPTATSSSGGSYGTLATMPAATVTSVAATPTPTLTASTPVPTAVAITPAPTTVPTAVPTTVPTTAPTTSEPSGSDTNPVATASTSDTN